MRTEVAFIPARVQVIDLYRETLECRTCRKAEKPYMKKAPRPTPVLQHSIASASSVAWVMHQKFVNSMPLNRQEKEWKSIGLDLSRATMANWMIATTRDWLKPLMNRLHQLLVGEQYLHADETPLQVMNERDEKTQRLPTCGSTAVDSIAHIQSDSSNTSLDVEPSTHKHF